MWAVCVGFDMVGFLFWSVLRFLVLRFLAVLFSFTGITVPGAAHELLTVHARARTGHAREGSGPRKGR
ncbi:hypothetical protein A8W25_23515 [Streptomyces sp. ERV7]|nr:hypothetical protein A8W25_23515 [Streptomyces sp. ERV7]